MLPYNYYDGLFGGFPEAHYNNVLPYKFISIVKTKKKKRSMGVFVNVSSVKFISADAAKFVSFIKRVYVLFIILFKQTTKSFYNAKSV